MALKFARSHAANISREMLQGREIDTVKFVAFYIRMYETCYEMFE